MHDANLFASAQLKFNADVAIEAAKVNAVPLMLSALGPPHVLSPRVQEAGFRALQVSCIR